MLRVLEIRSYNLKPGALGNFEQVFRRQALPMLLKHGTDVVAAGVSLADGDSEGDSFYLMRAYADKAARESSQSAFYGSAAWREGPRAAVLACIENYTTIVIEANEAVIDGLRVPLHSGEGA